MAITPNNITSGFRITGILHIIEIYSHDFLPSHVTDRGQCSTNILAASSATVAESNTLQSQSTDKLRPQTLLTNLPASSATSSSVLSPENIRPLPKAGRRSSQRKQRRKRKTEILIDTPVEN